MCYVSCRRWMVGCMDEVQRDANDVMKWRDGMIDIWTKM